MPYVRTVKTSSGATAVQIVYSSRRGSREIEHLGSAHSGAQVELLKAAARQRLAAGQGELDLGLAVGVPGGPLPITASRMGHLWDGLVHAYRMLGFDRAAGRDEVFAQLVLARIIEPTSKLDSARVLEEAGIGAPSYRTLLRRLPIYAKGSWRQKLAAACAGHTRLRPASLVLYDVSTFRRCSTIEIQAGDHTITAAHPLPEELRDTLNGTRPCQGRTESKIGAQRGARQHPAERSGAGFGGCGSVRQLPGAGPSCRTGVRARR